MPFGFSSPASLLLLAAIPAAVWLARRSLAGLPPVRRALALALRAAVLALLALALAGMRVHRISDRLACIFLVDRSASIPPDRRQGQLEFVTGAVRASAARRPDDLVGVVAFGATAGIEASPRRELYLDGFYTVIQPDGTDIASAIRLGAASFPPGCARRLVLVSDGNETAGRAADEARAAAGRGIGIDVVPIRYRYDPEVLLDKVIVPEGMREGEPFELRAVVEATGAGRGTLRIFENGRIVESREVAYRAGKNVYAMTLRRWEPRAYRYEAQIEAEDDRLAANNMAHGIAMLRGRPRVLVCAKRGGREPGAERLLEALRAEGLALDVVPPDGLPSAPEDFLGYDVAVLADVHTGDIGPARMALLHGLVKETGLGLVVVGGPDAFGAGGYGGTPLERALPVSMDLRGRKILPNGALVLIFHTCEFPEGNAWAKRIAKAAIEVLTPRDLVGVLYYGAGEQWLFPLRPADPGTMFPLIDGMWAGDMPDFDATLVMAERALRGAKAGIKHIVIISDGDPAPPSAQVLAALVKDRITVSTVFITSHGDGAAGAARRLMRDVARMTGGRFWPLRLGDVQRLPQIFIREATEVRRAAIVEEPFAPRVVRPSPILKGIDPKGIPRLRGYVATTPKPLADVVIISGQEDPILATWRYALGKVVAFTSDATARWARDWLAWDGFRKFWAQAVRWASRAPTREGFRVSRRIEDGRARLVVDAVDREGRFRNYLRLEGRVLDPRGGGEAVPFRQVGPGRYAADVPVGAPGSYMVHIGWTAPDGGRGRIVSGLSLPYSREFRVRGTNEALLAEIARIGRGRIVEADALLAGEADPFRRGPKPPAAPRPVWSALLTWAAWLFLADVFVRRVAVDPRRAWAWALAHAGRLLGRVKPARIPDARLEALLRAKATARRRAGTGALPEAAVEAGDRAPSPRGIETGEAGADAAGRERAEEEAEPPGYTKRLLEAKKRAIRREEEGS